ncbi:MAG: hypothetical protein ACXWWC_06965 [Chitinophagaceae bacterium]
MRITTNGLDIVCYFENNYMETDQLKLEKSWESVKEALKEINIELTNDDLAYQPGQEDQLLGRLEKKMKKSKTEIKALIESISANQGKAS